jgi:hypothetical protein
MYVITIIYYLLHNKMKRSMMGIDGVIKFIIFDNLDLPV